MHRKTVVKRSAVVTATIAVVAVAAATAAHGSASASSLSITLITSQTGSTATTCAPEVNGAKLAVAEANRMRETITVKRGGKLVKQSVPYLRGVNIDLSLQDDQSTPAGGVTAFRAAANNSLAIAGPCSSTPALALAP